MSDNYKEFVNNIRELLTSIKSDGRCQEYIEQNDALKSFIDVLTLHLITPTEEQKEEPKPIPWENKVKVGTYFQIIDPTVKDFGEVKEFTRLDIEDDDMYLVFSDGYGCNSKVILPYVREDVVPVWHIFAVRCKKRDELEEYLSENGIATNKHYPIPIHLQECYKDMRFKQGDFPIAEEISETELSLPMYYGMTDNEVQYVIETINHF